MGRYGGREKGRKNKRTIEVERIAAQYELNPFEVLIMIANADNEGLKTDEKIPVAVRGQAAKEAAKYLYPQKQAVQLSTDPEVGFKVRIEDYSSK
jgi:hypothetical protein